MDRLAALLLDARESGARGAGHESLTRQLRAELLRSGSETPDNLDAVEHVEYGEVARVYAPRGVSGLKLAGSDVLITDILNTAEGTAVPPEVRAEFPDLTQEQWDAALRWATMVLISLQTAPGPAG